MNNKVNIKEPFWSAGTKYGWPGSRTGLGIRKDLCVGEGNLEVTIGDDKDTLYRITKPNARSLVSLHQSFFSAGKTMLAVIPLFGFEVIYTGKKAEQKKVADIKQNKLFAPLSKNT